MANYYTQFCINLPIENEQQRDWLQNTYEKLNRDLEDSNDGPLGFELTFEGTTAYIDSGESGTPINAADLIHDFLREFRPSGCVCLEWADYCGKLRAGAFGGGAFFITAGSIESMSSSDWCAERAQTFKAAQEKS